MERGRCRVPAGHRPRPGVGQRDRRGQVLRRSLRHDRPPAPRPAAPSRRGAQHSMRRPEDSRRCAPSPRRSGAAGSTSSARAGTSTPSSAELGGHLAEKLRAPSVAPGRYDLVIDPTNLWLTIHESIGHATELDRALGYEAAYAGTSFATFDQLGSLRYGSELMNVTGDRTTPYGLATHRDRRRRGRRAVLRHRPRRRSRRLPARPEDRGRGGLRPLERLRLRVLAAHDADPADGERLARAGAGRRSWPRGAHLRRRARHLRRRRQELVDRHAALQLPVHRAAFLRDRARPARRPAPRRRLPGDDDGVLGLALTPRRDAPPTCSAGRSTAARASRARPRR